jgi:2-oxoglutarate ferredoxin oxidoreductase subunit beta
MKKAYEWGDKIPIGLFYKENKPTYGDKLPQIRKKPLVDQDISDIDISSILEEAK